MKIETSNIILIIELIYVFITLGISIIIILDTRSISKTLAYLLLVIFIPILGIIFYLSFGINYRKRKIYNKKLYLDENLTSQFQKEYTQLKNQLFQQENEMIDNNKELIKLVANHHSEGTPVFYKNTVQLLKNGESFFPLLIQELEKAKHHIHIQFYIYENDEIGNQIKNLLIRKAKEGIIVRFIYDDFGSKSIRKKFVKELIEGGVFVFPFNKIKLVFLANRMNYRNHRKIVIIDGSIGFTGGINVSDKYINPNKFNLYWRDTNIYIKGNAVYGLQRIFLADWNFCSRENLKISSQLFPLSSSEHEGTSLMQIASNGPDSEHPTILYSIIQAINSAKNEILLTTPYYIPDSSLQKALIISALSGVSVKLLVPKKGDSNIVTLASQAYFEDLLKAGVKIFLYDKGFIHAKTFVTDCKLACVGTANLDLRSFDLNFEINAIIYDNKIAEELAQMFEIDLSNSTEINVAKWKRRSKFKKFREKLFRLISPFL